MCTFEFGFPRFVQPAAIGGRNFKGRTSGIVQDAFEFPRSYFGLRYGFKNIRIHKTQSLTVH